MRVRLKGVAKVRKKLASGEIRVHYYAWRGGPKLAGQPGTPEFVNSYSDAHKTRKTQPQGLVFTLISEFKSSSEFTTKSKSTQRAYSFYLRMIEDEFGDMPIAALEDPAVRGEFMTWRDKLSEKPRTADYAWTTLARVFSVAKDRGRIKTNPCEQGGRLYNADRNEKIWGEADIGRFIAAAPPELELALMTAIWTGQRQGDLLNLKWSSYDGKAIRLKQSKSGRHVIMPAPRNLRIYLDGAPRRSIFILTNTYGQPWTSDGFRSSWGKVAARAKIKDLTFHDLRGTAVVRLAVAGGTVPEIATFTGHSLKDVEAILDAHYLGRDVKLAENAVRKLDRKEKRNTRKAAG